MGFLVRVLLWFGLGVFLLGLFLSLDFRGLVIADSFDCCCWLPGLYVS